MLKFTLTIETDNAAEFARISALLNSTAVGANVNAMTTASIAAPVLPAVPTGKLPEARPPQFHPATAPAPAAATLPVNPDLNPNPPELDSTGMPWDERIHSPNKTVNANGSWRKARGVEDALVAAVEAERRVAPPTPAAAVQPPAPPVVAPIQPAPPAAVATPPAPPVVIPDPFAPVPAAPVAPLDPFAGAAAAVQPPITPAAPVVQPADPAPTLPENPTFGQFIAIVSGKMKLGILTPDYMGGLCRNLGISTITDLNNNPAKLTEAVQLLTIDGKY